MKLSKSQRRSIRKYREWKQNERLDKAINDGYRTVIQDAIRRAREAEKPSGPFWLFGLNTSVGPM